MFTVLSNKGLLSSYYYSINMQGAKNCQFGHTHVNVVQSVSIEFPYCVLRTRLAKHRSRVDELGHPSSESQVRYTWPATNIVLVDFGYNHVPFQDRNFYIILLILLLFETWPNNDVCISNSLLTDF